MQPITSISNKLIELLRNQDFIGAYQDLFSGDAESFDPLNPHPSPLKGLAKLVEREKQFLSKVSILNIDVSEAIHAGNYFTIRLFMQFRLNEKEMFIDELCIYKVADGKIIKQQFLC
ncbi:hypothetical protein HDC92_004925 [Pedobacter sp. AK017]|uniref:nuclear transport factor 2 family protein n=1 Tax=Pedobacter sp. AK017 TaxID=2723073 RepID=UPI0016081090|nr:nuclear transport factor 2 family protein [Pedobacter sp. AK017]MBB5441218.1 hypothetical protein [Pedobacter sp. AK017]